jgi:hypothetical protein
MHTKKGQAALEFLTTYGWAFLVILVMIGALAYFGVLDPTRFLPQRCQFGAEMHCDQFALDFSDGEALFALKNSLPDHVFITNVEWKIPETDTWNACEDGITLNIIALGAGQQFNRDSIADFTCTDTTAGAGNLALGGASATLIEGDKQRIQFRITYNEGTAASLVYAKNIFGEIYANVRN